MVSKMNKKSLRFWGVFLGFGVLANFTALPMARAELVYEDGTTAPAEQAQAAAPAAPTAPVEEREAMRQVINTSQKQQATAQAAAPQAVQVQQAIPAAAPVAIQYQAPVAIQPAPVPAAAPAPVYAQESSAPQAEVQNLSRYELLRRERMREELKNEDILQHRLEELRLRDEKRRTDQLLGMNAGSEAKGQASPLAMSQEIVQAPVTDLNAQRAQIVAPQASPDFQAGPQQANYMGGQPVYSDQIQYGRSAVSQMEVDGQPFKSSVSIVPRVGISNMAGTNLFNTQSRFSLGLGLSIEVAPNVALDLGYTYNEYGVGLKTGNFYIDNNPMNYTSNFFTNYVYKQNIIDAGMRFYFLKKGAIVRPYLGGGAAYSMGSMNYDPSIQNLLSQYGAQYLNQAYQTNSFLGFIQAGADLNVAKSVSVGVGFKYYQVLSANENQQMNPYGFYGGFIPTYDPQKMISGGSLARSNFYSILGTVSFIF